MFPSSALRLFFLLATPAQEPSSSSDESLYLSLNIEEGKRLELSDGSTYEIAPEDRLYTIYWITPFPIMLGKSDDPDYPVKITNVTTGTSVNGKKISTKEMLEEEKGKSGQAPPPSIKPPPNAPKLYRK